MRDAGQSVIKTRCEVDGPRALNRNRPRRNYARWRALTLSLVYVVFAIHIVHWKITGKTLAPLELNEVMYTLELGIITAGFLFMCVLVLGTMLLGRFFCSWACHIMVLQDLCAWLLRKVGIRAKPMRSRLLLLVPPLTAFYMFLWPQIVRAWRDKAFPTFHFASDAQGWASLVTNNFWRNLPGPWIIALTFVVCGVVMVYVLGSRSFCTYVCPYGAIFGLADRFTLGRIRVNDRCRQCGTCTATCTSGVPVHEEVRQHGMVVNPACLKDLDCVSACPQSALSYGLAKPALFRSYRSGGRFGLPYEFTIAEEFLAAAVFVLVLLSFRGLYSKVPFLLSLAMGVIFGYGAVQLLRLHRRPNVRLAKVALKTHGKRTAFGWVYAAVALVLAALVGHSAFIRYHEYTGLRGVVGLRALTDTDQRKSATARARTHLLTADRWGLIHNDRVLRDLTSTSLDLDMRFDAETYATKFLERYPQDADVRLNRARGRLLSGNAEGAEQDLRVITDAYQQADAAPPSAVSAFHMLAGIRARRGAYESALRLLGVAIQFAPNWAKLHADAGSILAETGQLEAAIESLREAIRLDPAQPDVHYNLGTLLAHQGRFAEAIVSYEEAAALRPNDPDLRNNLGFALARSGEPARAREQFTKALALNPNHADAHLNLAKLLIEQDELAEAQHHLRQAAHLDARYARMLNEQ